MVRIPTIIPEYWAERWQDYWRQALIDRLWQLVLVVVGTSFVVAVALSGPGFIVAFIIGTALSVILTDDIRKTVSNIWNRNFWIWRVRE